MKLGLVVPLLFIFFVLLEKLFPLRENTIVWTSRVKDNILLAIFGLPFTRLLIYPVVSKIALQFEATQRGLLFGVNLSEGLLVGLSFILLDYLLYWWHRFNHRISFLWRFHQVHHADPEMDASTALRFHFGELLLSGGVRVVLVMVFGFSLKVLIVFDVLVTGCALFHHSNLKLKPRLEEVLRLILVTPTFHQNHHSYFQKETDSNFSTILSVWDRLHQTHTEEQKAQSVTIGVPYIGKVMPGPLNLVVMPFKKLSAWPKKFISRDL